MVPQTPRPTLENRKRLKNADLPESMSQLETIAHTDLSQASRLNVPAGTWPFSYRLPLVINSVSYMQLCCLTPYRPQYKLSMMFYLKKHPVIHTLSVMARPSTDLQCLVAAVSPPPRSAPLCWALMRNMSSICDEETGIKLIAVIRVNLPLLSLLWVIRQVEGLWYPRTDWWENAMLNSPGWWSKQFDETSFLLKMIALSMRDLCVTYVKSGYLQLMICKSFFYLI